MKRCRIANTVVLTIASYHAHAWQLYHEHDGLSLERVSLIVVSASTCLEPLAADTSQFLAYLEISFLNIYHGYPQIQPPLQRVQRLFVQNNLVCLQAAKVRQITPSPRISVPLEPLLGRFPALDRLLSTQWSAVLCLVLLVFEQHKLIVYDDHFLDLRQTLAMVRDRPTWCR